MLKFLVLVTGTSSLGANACVLLTAPPCSASCPLTPVPCFAFHTQVCDSCEKAASLVARWVCPPGWVPRWPDPGLPRWRAGPAAPTGSWQVLRVWALGWSHTNSLDCKEGTQTQSGTCSLSVPSDPGGCGAAEVQLSQPPALVPPHSRRAHPCTTGPLWSPGHWPPTWSFPQPTWMAHRTWGSALPVTLASLQRMQSRTCLAQSPPGLQWGIQGSPPRKLTKLQGQRVWAVHVNSCASAPPDVQPSDHRWGFWHCSHCHWAWPGPPLGDPKDTGQMLPWGFVTSLGWLVPGLHCKRHCL